jgi:small GTP-binding protein
MVEALKREPLYRALRCDKLILSGLESTVDAYLRGESRVPVLEMMRAGIDELEARAERIVAAVNEGSLRLRVATARAHVGGGTLPRSVLPSIAIEVTHPQLGAQALATLLRRLPEPVIGYVGRGSLKLDLRTVFPHQDEAVIRALRTLGTPGIQALRHPRLMAEATHYIVATAGHVDHGKSALVKALTGTDPDRLPEEKARGITIDLGFARLELPSPAGSAPIHVGIVDVPGHEDFVKNMVAGVGAIDLALLIVATDDGWMPQTEEHLQILSYFGVRRAVVALTKVDLAADENTAIADVRTHLEDSVFAEAPIVPTSVVTGQGARRAEIHARA